MNSCCSSTITLVDSRAARKERDSLGWATVVLQPIRVEHRINRRRARSDDVVVGVRISSGKIRRRALVCTD